MEQNSNDKYRSTASESIADEVQPALQTRQDLKPHDVPLVTDRRWHWRWQRRRGPAFCPCTGPTICARPGCQARTGPVACAAVPRGEPPLASTKMR
eukprot:scaffold292189_cov21-Tisochrysis_lutea.AAC.1